MNDLPSSAIPVSQQRIWFIVALLSLLLSPPLGLQAQGMFIGYNGSAPTRLGEINGPLAGNTILGQMLAGAAPDNLAPVGGIRGHVQGIWSMGRIEIPGIEEDQIGYVQFRAWDSVLWGMNPDGIPQDQFGRTDIVSVLLGGWQPPAVFFAPDFNTPAIVAVPEPPTWALMGLGIAALWGRALRSQQARAALVGEAFPKLR